MAAGSGYFQARFTCSCPLISRKSFSTSKVKNWPVIGGFDSIGALPGQMAVQVHQGRDRDHPQLGDQGNFYGVAFRHEQACKALLAGAGSHGEDAARVPDAAVQGKLTDHHGPFRALLRQQPQKPSLGRQALACLPA